MGAPSRSARVRHLAPGDDLQAAVAAAVDGDVLVLSPGVHRGPLEVRGRSIVIRSLDPEDPDVVDRTVLDGGGQGPAVLLAGDGRDQATPTIAGLTIRNGDAWRGGGVLAVVCAPVLRSCVIAGNTAGAAGGGIALVGTDGAVLQDLTVAGNRSAGDGAGIASVGATATRVVACTVLGNTAEGNGGGVAHHPGQARLAPGALWFELERTDLDGNRAGGDGGALASAVPSIRLTGCTIVHNVAGYRDVRVVPADGDPGYVRGSGEPGRGRGGALAVGGVESSGVLEVVESRLTGNVAAGGGGGIALIPPTSGELRLLGSQVDDNVGVDPSDAPWVAPTWTVAPPAPPRAGWQRAVATLAQRGRQLATGGPSVGGSA